MRPKDTEDVEMMSGTLCLFDSSELAVGNKQHKLRPENVQKHNLRAYVDHTIKYGSARYA